MSNKRVLDGIRASSPRSWRLRGLMVVALVAGELLIAQSAPALANANSSASNCAGIYDPQGRYPGLSEFEGPDVSSAGVVIYLHHDRAVAELEGCFYQVDRALEIDFTSLDFVTLLFEFPDHETGSRLFVTHSSGVVETVKVSEQFDYVVGSDEKLGFEYAPAMSTAPTKPIITSMPSSGNPKP